MITDQIKQQIAVRMADLVALVNRRYGINLSVPPVLFDCNDSRGGYYNPQNGTVHLNPILTIQNLADYVAVTVPHELAHYVQDKVYPETLLRKTCHGYHPRYGFVLRKGRRKDHGREWKSIMRLFGIRNPERCHSYDTSDIPKKRNVKKVPVYCQCGKPHMVTHKIISNIQVGRTYTCRACKTRISLTAPIPA